MEELPRDYEMLVLDDASTDQTLDVLEPYERVLPLTVIRNEKRGGYGAAIERLIREAVSRATHPRRDLVVTIQADSTEAPEDLPSLIKLIEGGADLVEGCIVSEGETAPANMKWAKSGVRWLLKGAPVFEDIQDPTSSFRAYRVSILKQALAERNGNALLTTDGWAANVELLAAVASHSRRTEKCEIQRRYELRQRESRFQPWHTFRRMWSLRPQIRKLPGAVEATNES